MLPSSTKRKRQELDHTEPQSEPTVNSDQMLMARGQFFGPPIQHGGHDSESYKSKCMQL